MAITAANLRRQSYEFQQDTAVGRWRWTTVVDVSGAGPSFSVTCVVSPMGILRDSIPIPGQVIEAMGESIVELRTQFPAAILIGAPSSLTFQVTEGEGFSLPQDVVLTNVGPFGSLLGATLSVSAGFLAVSPAQIGNLASNEAGSFAVSVDSSGLLAVDTPYTETVSVQDPAATNSPQVLSVTINVLPKGTISASPSTLYFTAIKPLSGSFAVVPSQTFVLTNTGPSSSVLDWQIQRVCCTPWLASFGPVSGTLASGESETVTVVVAPAQSTMQGTYTETLRVSGFSTNQTLDVTLQLTVT